MSTVGIYQIRNARNGHRYIGQAADIQRRLSYHLWGLRKGVSNSRHLQAAWKKYGETAFVFEVLAKIDTPISKQELTDLEQDYVDFFLPEYNIARECVASNLGIKRSADTLARMSAVRRGRPISSDQRAKLSVAGMGNQRALGHRLSAEARENIGAMQRGRKKSPEALAHMIASWTPERRAKQSEAIKAYYRRCKQEGR